VIKEGNEMPLIQVLQALGIAKGVSAIITIWHHAFANSPLFLFEILLIKEPEVAITILQRT
jgi:hypothetical protein